MVANTDQTKSPVERLTDLLTLAINLTSGGNRSPEQVDQLIGALNIFIQRLFPNLPRELHPKRSIESRVSNDISLLLVLCGQAAELAIKSKRTDREINELMEALQKFKELTSIKKLPGQEESSKNTIGNGRCGKCGHTIMPGENSCGNCNLEG